MYTFPVSATDVVINLESDTVTYTIKDPVTVSLGGRELADVIGDLDDFYSAFVNELEKKQNKETGLSVEESLAKIYNKVGR